MQKAQLLQRIDDVIARGEDTVNSVGPLPSPKFNPNHLWVKADAASSFRTAGLRLLEQVYGTEHQLYKDFERFTHERNVVSPYKQALALIRAVRDEATNGEDFGTPKKAEHPQQARKDAVFLVHGHDDGARELVARFLEKLGIKPIILHEQPNQGRTVIEKLEHHADVAFAVVLLTPDDIGGKYPASDNPQSPRARQNVVLELGFFVGKLGRQYVCALHKGELELPSDYVGVVFVPLDPGGGWRLLLARELKAAGFDVDMNKIA